MMRSSDEDGAGGAAGEEPDGAGSVLSAASFRLMEDRNLPMTAAGRAQGEVSCAAPISCLAWSPKIDLLASVSALGAGGVELSCYRLDTWDVFVCSHVVHRGRVWCYDQLNSGIRKEEICCQRRGYLTCTA